MSIHWSPVGRDFSNVDYHEFFWWNHVLTAMGSVESFYSGVKPSLRRDIGPWPLIRRPPLVMAAYPKDDFAYRMAVCRRVFD